MSTAMWNKDQIPGECCHKCYAWVDEIVGQACYDSKCTCHSTVNDKRARECPHTTYSLDDGGGPPICMGCGAKYPTYTPPEEKPTAGGCCEKCEKVSNTFLEFVCTNHDCPCHKERAHCQTCGKELYFTTEYVKLRELNGWWCTDCYNAQKKKCCENISGGAHWKDCPVYGPQEKPEWETIIGPRRGGKISEALALFYSDCKKGKAVIFRMPEGDIYSPKALERHVTAATATAYEKGKADGQNELLKAASWNED